MFALLQDFLQGVDIQLHDHMRRGPSLAAVDVALGPAPQSLEVRLACFRFDEFVSNKPNRSLRWIEIN